MQQNSVSVDCVNAIGGSSCVVLFCNKEDPFVLIVRFSKPQSKATADESALGGDFFGGAFASDGE